MNIYVLSTHVRYESTAVELVCVDSERVAAYVETEAENWRENTYDYAAVQVWHNGGFVRVLAVWTQSGGVIDELAARVRGSVS